MAVVSSNLLLEAALDYAARGWKVFPCHTPIERDGGGYSCSCRDKECATGGSKEKTMGKHPRLQHGLKDASTDKRHIEAWWQRWPLANIGICTGDGLMVLDVDPENGGSTVGLSLPDTRRVVTHSGGEHWYYRVRGDVRNSAGQVGVGLDIRGDGGYVIAPPSLGYTGRLYGFDLGSSDEIAEAPGWLVALARKERVSPPANGAPSPDAFLAGARNDALTRLGGGMVRMGMGQKAIEVALLSENARRCRPPMDEREVVGIARSVIRYQPSAPVVGQETVFVDGPGYSEPLPPIPWVCERLELAPGAVNIWAGYGYSGKSLAAQSLLLAVADGHAVWGMFPCATGHVLYLDYEQGKRLTAERYQRLCRSSGLDLSELGDRIRGVHYPALYLDTPEGLVWLEDICRSVKLCVIDSLRAALPSADENSSDIRKYLDPLSRISEKTGCVIILIHHARKDSELSASAAQSVRGSGAIFDACQSVCFFRASKEEPTRVELAKARITGSHHTDLAALSFEDVEGVHDDPEQDGRPDPRWGLRVKSAAIAPVDVFSKPRAKILLIARQEPGLSKNELCSAVGGKKQITLGAVKRLLAEGLLVSRPADKQGGGEAIFIAHPDANVHAEHDDDD